MFFLADNKKQTKWSTNLPQPHHLHRVVVMWQGKCDRWHVTGDTCIFLCVLHNKKWYWCYYPHTSTNVMRQLCQQSQHFPTPHPPFGCWQICEQPLKCSGIMAIIRTFSRILAVFLKFFLWKWQTLLALCHLFCDKWNVDNFASCHVAVFKLRKVSLFFLLIENVGSYDSLLHHCAPPPSLSTFLCYPSPSPPCFHFVLSLSLL